MEYYSLERTSRLYESFGPRPSQLQARGRPSTSVAAGKDSWRRFSLIYIEACEILQAWEVAKRVPKLSRNALSTTERRLLAVYSRRSEAPEVWGALQSPRKNDDDMVAAVQALAHDRPLGSGPSWRRRR